MYSNETENFYELEGEELAFFQKLTKIQAEDDLKAHIVNVQREAFGVFGYNCIRSFAFLKFKISRVPGYKEAVKLLRTRKDPILLDIGCCFGNDTRKAVVDGWPVDRIIASDLRQEFWNYGHQLFKSTPETFAAKFIAGNVFDPNIIAPRGPYISPSDIFNVLSTPTPELSALTSLTPLQGKIHAIHASSFFDVFSEDEQRGLARLLASLLRPEKGAVIFGQHCAMPVKGFRRRWPGRAPIADADKMFCHSPETWRVLWMRDVFGGGDGKGEERIKVDVELEETERRDLLEGRKVQNDERFYIINWCITRL